MVTEKQKRHIQKRKIHGSIVHSTSERLSEINTNLVKLNSKRKSVKAKSVVTMPPESPAIIVRVMPLNKKYRRARSVVAFIGDNLDKSDNARVQILGNRDPVRCLSGFYLGDIINGLNNIVNQNGDKKLEKRENE